MINFPDRHNKLRRVHADRDGTRVVLYHLKVPATNTLAERDIRVVKRKHTISGSFRTADGAMNCAILRRLIATARQLGLNALDTLATDAAEVLVLWGQRGPLPDT
ncbi:MAG: transposase [Rhodobacteraceae bacterium]|nr:transposase [Paracoccaceae bacterium]